MIMPSRHDYLAVALSRLLAGAWRGNLGRSELATDLYDETPFGGATLSDENGARRK